VGGHFSSVQQICWDPKGQFLLSASLDQTTRIFAPWKQNNKETYWYEIARPQIHGYDLQCVSFIGSFRYASGADEKVVRIFDAPATFVKLLSNLIQAPNLMKEATNRPNAANLPPLGLSNKAVNTLEEEGEEEKEEDMDESLRQSYASSYKLDLSLTQPPFNEQLARYTLWPEIEKLYGHPFEIVSVATSQDERYLATSCKATSNDYAVVRIYDTTNWKQVTQLAAHSLTVTKIRFSHNDQWLLTVSRDRSWTLYKRTTDPTQPFQLYRHQPKAHTRIIWDASWSSDDTYFATGSRDKTIKIWQMNDANCIATITCESSVTAMDFIPNSTNILAVGLEQGQLQFYQLQASHWQLIGQIPSPLAHAASVQSIQWRPTHTSDYQLATCSQDHSLRIFTIQFS
jgi:elongator complex protein 2